MPTNAETTEAVATTHNADFIVGFTHRGTIDCRENLKMPTGEWPSELLHTSDASARSHVARYDRIKAPSMRVLQTRTLEDHGIRSRSVRPQDMQWSPVTNFCAPPQTLRQSTGAAARSLAMFYTPMPVHANVYAIAPDRPSCRDTPQQTFLNVTRGV